MIEVYSAKQAAEIDSIAIEERGFERTILMENAGRSVAEAIFNLDIERRSAAVICGKGHNGGDGIVAARHLRENGWEVLVVFIEDPEDFAPDTKYFFDLLSLGHHKRPKYHCQQVFLFSQFLLYYNAPK